MDDRRTRLLLDGSPWTNIRLLNPTVGKCYNIVRVTIAGNNINNDDVATIVPNSEEYIGEFVKTSGDWEPTYTLIIMVI